jgi:hypothetical protein
VLCGVVARLQKRHREEVKTVVGVCVCVCVVGLGGMHLGIHR